jgi:YHS domain-containing protein
MTAPKRDPEVAGRRSGGQVARGTLHKDPVCGTYVSEDVAVKLDAGGRVDYFCSAGCRDSFRASSQG